MVYERNDSGGMSAAEPATKLASPHYCLHGWRLAAWVIDTLIYFVVGIATLIVGVAVAGVGLSDINDFDFSVILGGLALIIVLPILSLLITFIIQMILLGMRGQTIGKIAVKIRVVDARTGEHPGWARLVLLRTIVNGILSGIPYLGSLYFFIDTLFIFGRDHRTIHDLIAGTRVDKVSN